MGLNLSNRQIAHLLGINEDDAQQMTQPLRQGVVAASSTPELSGTVEIDEVYVVAGHKGQHDEVQKKVVWGRVDDTKGSEVEAQQRRTSLRSWV